MAADKITDAIIDLAHLYGWLAAHFRSMEGPSGWRTPVGADGKGFPDLVLVHPRYGVLFVECKGTSSGLGPEQIVWRDALLAAGGRWELWRPRDITDGTVARALGGA